jgi:hypothetical protein
VDFPGGAVVWRLAGDIWHMAELFDEAFYKRADAHIALANEETEEASHEAVNASMMFASARFCAFLSARGFKNGDAMGAKREETVDYFVAGFRQMLEGNLDAYIRNFDAYMNSKDD